MKVGLLYEHQVPRPWGPDSEYRRLQEALDQVELADRVGVDYVWEVEHHFLEERLYQRAERVAPIIERAMKRKKPPRVAKSVGPTIIKAVGGYGGIIPGANDKAS